MSDNTHQPLDWRNVPSTGGAISHLGDQTAYVIVKGESKVYVCLDGPSDSDRVILGEAATRAAGKKVAQQHYAAAVAAVETPSSEPLLLFLKGTWAHEAPFPGSGGYLSSSSVSDAYTPGNAAMYAEKDYSLVDQWAIYLTPDRRALFTVDMDGSLRSWWDIPAGSTARPLPHPHWAA